MGKSKSQTKVKNKYEPAPMPSDEEIDKVLSQIRMRREIEFLDIDPQQWLDWATNHTKEKDHDT